MFDFEFKGRIILFSVLALGALGCSSKKPVEINDFVWEANYDDYNIAYLNFEERYFYSEDPITLELNFPHDRNGIKVSLFDGEYVYHPWTLTNMALQYISGYYVTQDSAYLDFSYRYAQILSDIGVRESDAIYFPYTFNYGLHGSNDVLMAPWYSGMAQGYALSFLSRLYELTEDNSIRVFADSIFNTFLHTAPSTNIWSCMIDSADYYWIEEYPFYPADHVLGGFTSGIIGLHDYYLSTRDERCGLLLKSSLTTIEHYFNEFRNPGDISYYCLLHKLQMGSYHILNAERLRYMAVISDAAIFDAYADLLLADYNGD